MSKKYKGFIGKITRVSNDLEVIIVVSNESPFRSVFFKKVVCDECNQTPESFMKDITTTNEFFLVSFPSDDFVTEEDLESMVEIQF